MIIFLAMLGKHIMAIPNTIKIYLLVTISVLSLFTWTWYAAYHKGIEAEVTKTEKSVVLGLKKGIKKHAEVQRQVNKLPNDNLDERFNVWLRD